MNEWILSLSDPLTEPGRDYSATGGPSLSPDTAFVRYPMGTQEAWDLLSLEEQSKFNGPLLTNFSNIGKMWYSEVHMISDLDLNNEMFDNQSHMFDFSFDGHGYTIKNGDIKCGFSSSYLYGKSNIKNIIYDNIKAEGFICRYAGDKNAPFSPENGISVNIDNIRINNNCSLYNTDFILTRVLEPETFNINNIQCFISDYVDWNTYPMIYSVVNTVGSFDNSIRYDFVTHNPTETYVSYFHTIQNSTITFNNSISICEYVFTNNYYNNYHGFYKVSSSTGTNNLIFNNCYSKVMYYYTNPSETINNNIKTFTTHFGEGPNVLNNSYGMLVINDVTINDEKSKDLTVVGSFVINNEWEHFEGITPELKLHNVLLSDRKYIEESGIQYIVTFYNFDGSIFQIVEVGEYEIPYITEHPTRVGHTFIGWDKPLTNTTENTSYVALYQINTYNVRFIGFNGVVINTISVEHGTILTLPPDPSLVSHNFISWNYSNESIISDRDITSNWEIKTFKVRFFEDEDGNILLEELTKSYGDIIYTNLFIAPTKIGYEFTGWNKVITTTTTEDITSTTLYEKSIIFTVTSNIDFIPTYEILKYNVTFNDYFGNIIYSSIVDYGSSAIAPNPPERFGYTFIGWSEDYSNITTNMDIYPLYKINYYKVTFKDSDQTTLKIEDVKYLKSATPPLINIKENYSFIGWDKSYNSIVEDTIVTAEYIRVHSKETTNKVKTYNQTNKSYNLYNDKINISVKLYDGINSSYTEGKEIKLYGDNNLNLLSVGYTNNKGIVNFGISSSLIKNKSLKSVYVWAEIEEDGNTLVSNKTRVTFINDISYNIGTLILDAGLESRHLWDIILDAGLENRNSFELIIDREI